MSFTITLRAWWVFAYLGVGAVLYLPLEWLAWLQIHNRPPFWCDLAAGIRKRPWTPFAYVVAWPWAAWEVAS